MQNNDMNSESSRMNKALIRVSKIFDRISEEGYANLIGKDVVNSDDKFSTVLSMLDTLVSDLLKERDGFRASSEKMELELQELRVKLAQSDETLQNERGAREQLVKEFTKQEKFYTDIFNSIQDQISVLDTDLNIVSTNSSMEEFYKEILPIAGKKCYWVYHHHEKPCIDCPSLETIRTGKAAYCIIPRRDAYGNQLGWEELYTFPWIDSTDGKLRGVIEFVRDITYLRTVEDALAEEKELLSVTMASIGEAVVSTDIHGTIISINPIALALTKFSAADAVGRPVDDIFVFTSSEGRNTPGEIVRNMIDNKGNTKPVSLRCNLCKPDGDERIIDLSIARINNKVDTVIGSVMVMHDITERLKLENELYKSSKIESLGVLAGGLAHDFNNILAGVIANLSLARLGMIPDSETNQLLLEAEKASFRASKLVKQLLTFSKGGAPVKESVALQGIIHDMVGFCLSGSTVRCDLDLAPDLADVEVDKGQIEQVLNNLIINAMQAMPQGGTVSVGARNEVIEKASTLDKMQGNVLEPGDYVCVYIKDQGSGIPKENLEKIFDPYFTTKPEGSGLGLAIVYSIIKAHKGAITVDSQAGKGATFTFYLPRATIPARTETGTMTQPVKADINQRVLILDDDETLCKAMKHILTMSGYSEIVCTANGADSLAAYQDAMTRRIIPFDVVIMDLTIPGAMGGKETVEKLLAIDPNARVVVSSGYSNDPIIANYQDYGFCGFITKPFRIDEFLSVIKNASIRTTDPTTPE